MGLERLSFISQSEIEKHLSEWFKEGTYDKNSFSKSGASYDLRLGKEVFVTPEKEPKQLRINQTLNIEPGQFAVLTTEEYLMMPDYLLGFITIRLTYKSKGLVNITGFHVDPGFEGKLVFSVFNAGPTTVTMRRCENVFSIFFAKIDPPTRYKLGLYQKQTKIPTKIIEALAGARAPSLQTLKEQVDRNWTTIKIYGTILTGLVITLLGAIISIL